MYNWQLQAIYKNNPWAAYFDTLCFFVQGVMKLWAQHTTVFIVVRVSADFIQNCWAGIYSDLYKAKDKLILSRYVAESITTWLQDISAL